VRGGVTHEACLSPPLALEKLRKTTNEIAQLESLKDLWLDGNLIEDETPPWRIKTPTRGLVFSSVSYSLTAANSPWQTTS
jgi:hypothetical protein